MKRFVIVLLTAFVLAGCGGQNEKLAEESPPEPSALVQRMESEPEPANRPEGKAESQEGERPPTEESPVASSQAQEPASSEPESAAEYAKYPGVDVWDPDGPPREDETNLRISPETVRGWMEAHYGDYPILSLEAGEGVIDMELEGADNDTLREMHIRLVNTFWNGELVQVNVRSGELGWSGMARGDTWPAWAE